jgi:hypothetical protein
MSILAFLLVLMAVLTKQKGPSADEEAGAHLFQLLIVAQDPIVMIFLATADWRKYMQVLRSMAFQAFAVIIAVGAAVFAKL